MKSKAARRKLTVFGSTIVAALAMFTALALPASAHTGTVNTSQTCNTDTGVVSWTASVVLNNNVTADRYVDVTTTIPGLSLTEIHGEHFNTSYGTIWSESGTGPASGTVFLDIYTLKYGKHVDEFKAQKDLPEVGQCVGTTTTTLPETTTTKPCPTTTTTTIPEVTTSTTIPEVTTTTVADTTTSTTAPSSTTTEPIVTTTTVTATTVPVTTTVPPKKHHPHPTASTKPSVPPAPPTASPKKPLAYTGSSTWWLVGVAFTLILAGFGLIRTSRRRRGLVLSWRGDGSDRMTQNGRVR